MRSNGSHGRRLALGLLSGSVVLVTAAAVHAQEGGFFEQLFGVAPRQAAPVQPRYERHDQFVYGYRRFSRHDRSERRRDAREQGRQAKTRYAALPKADPDQITGKQPVDQKAILDNPTKAILNDQTLRAGDVVILPRGPKVFAGGSAKRHHIGEFQDVKSTQLIDRKTRQQLLAMMVPIGAMPADQARKVMAQTRALKRKLAHPDEIAAVEAKAQQADASVPLRIIVPWKPSP